jgi:hypothetical protein
MSEATLAELVRRTALEILNRHAPDCLRRRALVEAIARLARQGIESAASLYQERHRQPPQAAATAGPYP